MLTNITRHAFFYSPVKIWEDPPQIATKTKLLPSCRKFCAEFKNKKFTKINRVEPFQISTYLWGPREKLLEMAMKYQTWPLLSCFPWLCVWGSCTLIFYQSLHVDHRKAVFRPHSLLCVQVMGYILAWRSHSFVCTFLSHYHYNARKFIIISQHWI